MPRIANPYVSASPYPTDPSWGQAGAALGTALFGDPEAAAKLALQRGQAGYYDAETEQARAQAGLAGSRQALVDQQTTARGRFTDPTMGLTPLQAAMLQGAGESADLANQLNEARGGDVLYRAADPAGAAATAASGGLGGALASIVAPTEDQLRASGALLGHMPTNTTAYTVGQGDHAQALDVAGKIAVNAAEPRIVADGSHLLVPNGQGGGPVAAPTPGVASGSVTGPMWGAAGQPRGVRNNNPLNLVATVNWNGMTGKDPGGYAQFDSPASGWAAADQNLRAYATRHGLNTVAGVVSRWAPASAGNNTAAYAASVAKAIGVDPNQPLPMNDVGVRQKLLTAMAAFENGRPVAHGQGGPGGPQRGGAPQAPGGPIPAGGGYTDVFYNPKPGSPQNTPIPDLPAGAPTGPAYLKTLPAARQAQIQGFIDGRLAPPNINSRANNTPENQALIRDIMQVDPTFDAVNFQARAKARANYTAGGKGTPAQSIIQLNQALGHLDGLARDADALGNYGGLATIANGPANLIATTTGDPRVTNFTTQRDAVVSELNNLLRGGVGAEGDIKRWLKNLDANASPDQLHGSISHIADLIGSRLEALQAGYTQGMGTTATPLEAVSPAMAEAMQRLSNLQKRAGAGSANVRVASTGPSSHVAPTGAGHLHDADLAAEFGH